MAHGDRNDRKLYEAPDNGIYRGNGTWVYDVYCAGRNDNHIPFDIMIKGVVSVLYMTDNFDKK